MSVLGRLLFSSAERLDLADFLSIDSYAAGDWKYFVKGLIGDNRPYIIKGFDVIDPEQSIGSTNVTIKVADSVVFYPTSSAGAFFHGLSSGHELSQPLVPELKKNTTNYVYLVLTTKNTSTDTRSFWDPDKEGGIGGEFTQDVNTASILSVAVNVSVSSFPQNTIPVCKVAMSSDFIESIEDCRDLMFRLGSGGMSSSAYNRYSFKELPSSDYARNEPNAVITSPLNPNPFQGGDKNINSLKEWMDAVMTKLAELGGTTFWYEDVSEYNAINTFNDVLATSIKSKGQWQHSDITPGKIIWTEDILYQTLQSNRDYVVRSGEKTLANNELMYIELKRELPVNDFGYYLTWFNSVDHVNGSIGSFSNLKKGDWVKKANDTVDKYLRVEEFYSSQNKGGGVTAPSSAKSIKLSAPYLGTSSIVDSVYSKGIYESSDVKVASRSSTDILNIGGNLMWIAFRSDTQMNVSNLTATILSLSISEQDGVKAKVTCLNNDKTSTNEHLLEDGESITIAGSVNYDGTYAIEKVNDSTFYINTDKTIDETVNGFYGVATTTTRYTNDGLLVESASHGFQTGQQIEVSGASSWNGNYKIYVKSNNKFSFPLSSSIADINSGLAILSKVYVKTEISQAKITQGETKYIGEVDTDNIQSFIGMDSISQFHPEYHVSNSYNTLNSSMNYNGELTDSLTDRVSKLTSMMADKAQDKIITFAADYNICINAINGLSNEITFLKDGGNPSLKILQNGSLKSCLIDLDGMLTLSTNKVAYFNIDRNADIAINSLNDLIIADFKDVPISENCFVFAYRYGDNVYLWDEYKLSVGNNTAHFVINDIINDNVYEEYIDVISAAPTNLKEITGPVLPDTNILLPFDSRDGDSYQGYIVGKGVLEIYLNGIILKLNDDWEEIGTVGNASNSFKIKIRLEVGDKLNVRIDTFGGYVSTNISSGGGGGGETNYGVNIGGYNEIYKLKLLEALQFRTIKSGNNIVINEFPDYLEISSTSASSLIVTTVSSDYSVLVTDDVVLVNALSGNIIITLPPVITSNGKKIDIKKIDSSVNSMIIDGNGSETIDGQLTQYTFTQNESFTIVCNGTAWFII